MIPSSKGYTYTPQNTCSPDSKTNMPSTSHHSDSKAIAEPTSFREREIEACDHQSHTTTESPHVPQPSLLSSIDTAIEHNNTDQLNTLLLVSCHHGETDCLKRILHHDATTLFHRNNDGRTALHIATLMKCLPCVLFIIELLPQTALLVDNVNNTPVHLAAACGATECLEALMAVDQGIQALRKQGNHQYTPLHYAVQYNHYECTRVIVELYPDCILLIDKDGDTPAHIAVMSRSIACLEVMTAKKQGLLALKSEGNHAYTPLHIAARLGYIECVKHIANICPESLLLQDIQQKNGPSIKLSTEDRLMFSR